MQSGQRLVPLVRNPSVRRALSTVIAPSLLSRLTALRHELHKTPEASGQEVETAAQIEAYLKGLAPDTLHTQVGGHGILAEYMFGQEIDNPKTVIIRADMDAVPVARDGRPYSHSCGHDGHCVMALGALEHLMGLGPELSGRVIVVFQPAEENGEGAISVLSDPKFKSLEIDPEHTHCIALHNIPGYKEAAVIMPINSFASASMGVSIRITGHSAHASCPQEGKNPFDPIMSFGPFLSSLPRQIAGYERTLMATPVHVSVGKTWNFGTAPPDGEVALTLRGPSTKDILLMKEEIERILRSRFTRGDIQTATNELLDLFNIRDTYCKYKL